MKLAISSLLFVLALLAAPCRALSVVPPTFARLVAGAEQIARVEVTAVHGQWDEGPQGNVIHTYVQCRVLRTLKGSPGATVTVRLLGGQVGNEHMLIPGMPTFAVGETYILFIAENGRAFCPLVGVMHGSYRVLADKATGVEHVARSNGEALRAVGDVSLPMTESSLSPAAAAAAARAPAATSGLTRNEFENAITHELTHDSTS